MMERELAEGCIVGGAPLEPPLGQAGTLLVLSTRSPCPEQFAAVRSAGNLILRSLIARERPNLTKTVISLDRAVRLGPPTKRTFICSEGLPEAACPLFIKLACV